jgi:membrane protease YdiL (CAAX protease family)
MSPDSHPASPGKKAFLALALLVPAPSLGALFGMVIFPNSLAGVLLFGASKVWLFGLPVVWLRFVDRTPLSLSPPKQGGFVAGILSGLLLSGFILAAYWALGDALIDRRFLADKLMAIGLGVPGRYAGGAAYWILVNSVLEEYVWRWFCVTQCERLLSKRLAVLCSALCFTLHHMVAMAVYFKAATVLICAGGIFVAGTIWSLMYIRYRSVWPGYVSHAIVDLCIFAIGAALLFGAR